MPAAFSAYALRALRVVLFPMLALAALPALAQSPEIRVNDASAVEGSSIVFTVSLSQPAGAGGVTFSAGTRDLTTDDAFDYTPVFLPSVTIPQGASSAQVPVSTSVDGYEEPVETFELRLSGITGATAADVVGIGSITDTSFASIGPASLPGGTVGSAYFAQLAVQPATGASWSLSLGTLPTGLTLNPANGQITGTPSAAGTRYFVVQANSGFGLLDREMSITISPSPTGSTEVFLEASPSRVTEDGAASLVFTAWRVSGPNANLAQSLSLATTRGGTATLGSDYAESGSFTIPAGAYSVSWTVDPTADVAAEADETVVYTLQNGGGYVIANPSVATGTISNDDTAPTATITVADTNLLAGETSQVTFTFSQQVSGFDLSDLTVENGVLSGLSSANGITYTATLTPTAGVSDPGNAITLNNAGVATLGGTTGVGTTLSNNYAVNTTRPTATLVMADSALAIGETSLLTVTFSEAVTGFTNADLTIANGSLSAVSSLNGGITWTATFTPTAGITDPSNVITLANAGVSNGAGNTGQGTTDSNNYAIDSQRPTASLVMADTSLAAGETSLLTITFSEAVTGFTNADLTVANGSLSAVSTSDGGITWTATFTPTAGISDASNLVTLANTGVADLAGNAGTGTTDSNNYAIDSSRPTATVVVADTALAAGETSLVTFTFSEAVTGFSNADLSVANGTLSAVASGDGGITWTATFTPTAGVSDASNLISLDNAGVFDAAGNAGTGTTNSNNYAIDTARPTATVVVADTNLAAGETTTVTITFNEAVAGLSVGDFTVANGVLSGLSSGDGGVTWTATLTPTAGISDPGNLITLDNTGVTDAAGNAGTGTTDSNNYAVDSQPPGATIVVADNALAAGETTLVTITFTEAVTGLTTADFTVANGVLSSLSSADGGITWTAALTPDAGVTDPSNLITLDNTGFTDLVGNPGVGTTDSNNYAVDSQRPLAILALADTNLAAGETTTVTATFNEAVTGLDTADFTVANGTLSGLSTADGGVTWTATLTPDPNVESAANQLSLDNTGLVDAAGNPGSGTSTVVYAIDTLRPTATLVVADTVLTAGETSLVTITFNEAVSGFDNADLTVANGTLSAQSSGDGGVTWTATFTPSAGVSAAGNLITLDNTGVQDAAGNTGTGSTDSNSYAIDTVVRSLSIDDVSVAEGNAGTTSAVFTVSLDFPAGPAGVGFDIGTNAGTATAGGDFVAQLLGGQVISAGNSSYTFTVQLVGDTNFELDEAFTVSVGNVTGASVADGQGAGVILNDDAAPVVSVTAGTVLEGDAGTVLLPLTFSLDAGVGETVTVDYATADDTATAGSDYTALSGTLTFNPGDDQRTLNVTVSGDTLPEADETLTVTLSNPVNASVGTPTASATITNDDVPVTVTPATLPDAIAGTAYSQALAGSGGDGGPYAFTLTAGSLPAGLTLGADGTLSGTATASGSFDFTVTATDGSAAPGPYSGSQAYTLVVAAPVLALAPASLPDATAGSAYSQVITASGGTAPYTFAPSAGALPAGLTLATDGTLSGTATEAGSFGFDVTATDSTGGSAGSGTASYTLQVAPPTLAFDPGSLSFTGESGTPLSFVILVNGGTGPYGFVLAGGSLPPGLGLAADGTLSGTATTSGDFSFDVSATDSTPGLAGSATATVQVRIDPATLVISPVLSDGTVGVPYGEALSTSGGIAPYSYSLTGGSLPPGLALGSDGVLSGTPTAGGSFAFDVTVVDSTLGTAATATRAFVLTMSATTLAITPATLPDATAGAAYSQLLAASGGTAPYTWTVLSGSLPAGLTLGADGTLSGTPTVTGGFNFEVLVQDATGLYANAGVFPLSLAVVAPTILVAPATLPDGGVGTAYGQAITASGGTAPYAFTLTAGALPPGLSLAADGTLSGTPTADGSFGFTVTATDAGGYAGDLAYTLLIAIAPPVAGDVSANVGYDAAATPITLALSGGAADSVAVASAPANGTAVASGLGITYQPNAGFSGVDSFTYTATNASGTSAPATVTVTVGGPTLAIADGGPGVGTVAVAFSRTFSFSGGSAPYTGLAVGGLPAGLSVTGTTADSVTVSGTPSEAGNFTLTVSGSDSSSGDGPFAISQDFALAIGGPVLTLAPAGPDLAADYNAAYSQAFSASGGVGPYSYAISGSVPPDLALAGDTLAGTPTAPGSYSFTITATDTGATGTGAPFTVAVDYTLTVAAANISITPAALPDGTAGSVYSAQLSASGGSAPYAFWIVDPGNFPPGMTFDGAGNLGGTPTTSGSYTFTVEVADQNSQGTQQVYTLVIAIAPPVAGDVSANVDYNAAATPITLALSGGTADSVAVASAPANGTAIASGTGITYQPNASFAGSDSFTYTATNASGTSAPATVSITVAAPVLVITDGGPANGNVATAFSRTFSFSGGQSPYTGLAVGGLPAGLAVTGTTPESITVSGTPTEAGSFTLTVSGSDRSTGNGPFAVSQDFALAIGGPVLTLAPAGPDLAADYNAAYSQAFSASGGIGPYSYAISGSVPPGLSLAGDTLSGTPTAPGSYAFTITATDTGATGVGAPFTVAVDYTLTVTAANITITPTTLPDGDAGTPYSQAISASGGVAPYAFTISGGALPAGLTLGADGTLAGTPTVAGSFGFTVTATDANGQAGALAYTLVLGAPVITLAPASLPDGTVGTAYGQAITASGGTAPHAFAISGGALPAGLTLGADGTLAGTPTSAGSFDFTVTATDALGFSGSLDLVLAVGEAAPVAVDDAATALSGEPVAIPVTANDSGVITGLTITRAPANGTAVVNGLGVDYTSNPGFGGSDDFAYVATGPGGSSAPATVVVTVDATPVAADQQVDAVAGVPVDVELTLGATGGPFTAASLVSLDPADAGTTAIRQDGARWILTFTPAADFSGVATLRFTLANAVATSPEATVVFTVRERDDPSKDAEVQGLVDAQVESARRFATAQIGNFQSRLERLHGGGENGGFENGLGFATDRACVEPLVGLVIGPCELESLAGNSAAPGAGSAGHAGPSRLGFWTGGMIRSGSQDGRDGRADIDFESDGLSAGMDYRVNDGFVFGGGIGWGRDDNAIGNNGSFVEGRASTMAVYASYHPGQRFFLDGLLGYQRLDFDLRRYLTATGGFVHGQREGSQWFASLSAGKDIALEGLQATPYLRLDLTRATLEGYTEAGDPILALRYGAMDADSSTGNLGLRLEWMRELDWGRVAPQLRIEYQHDFSGRSGGLVQYADLVGGPVYRLESQGLDRSRFIFGLGALLQTADDWSFRLEMRGQVGSDGESDTGLLLNIQKDY